MEALGNPRSVYSQLFPKYTWINRRGELVGRDGNAVLCLLLSACTSAISCSRAGHRHHVCSDQMGLAMLVFHRLDSTLPNRGFLLFAYGTQLPGMLDEFGFGNAVARLMKSKYAGRLVDHEPEAMWILYSLTALVLSLTAYAWARHPNYADTLPAFMFFRAALGLSCAMIILIACANASRGLMWISAPFRYMGRISYGLYLWHLLVINPLVHCSWLTGDRTLPVVSWVMMSWRFFEALFLHRFTRAQQKIVTPGHAQVLRQA